MEDQKGSHQIISRQQARQKVEAYCAYQERSQKEVREKLYQYGLKTPDVEELIAELIETNFLNEERFALAYAGGKFRIKHWGKKKIRQGLKLKGVSDKLISKATSSIDDTDYLDALWNLLMKKNASLSESDALKRKKKLLQYAVAKGYEPDLIFDVLKSSELS